MDYGISIQGTSFFDITDNEFYNIGVTGQELISTGANNNSSALNYTFANAIGITARFENSGYQFSANCFENNTNSIDFVLNGHGTNFGVLPTQGLENGVSASNEFTRPGTFSNNRSIARVDALRFDYMITNGTPLSSNLHPNYETAPMPIPPTFTGTKPLASFDTPRDCHPTTSWTCIPPSPVGSGLSEIVDLPEGQQQEGRGSYNRSAMLTLVQQIESNIVELEGTHPTSLPTDPGFFEVAKLSAQKNRILSTIVYHESFNNNFEFLKETLGQYGFSAKRFILSSYIEQMRYAEASTYLSTISASSEAEQDYLYAQEINIDRLNNPAYEASELSLNNLRQIVEKHHPLGGKAHAVYHALTNEIVICEHNSQSHSNELAKRELKAKEIEVFPNPAQDKIYFRGAEGVDYISIMSLEGLTLDRIPFYEGLSVDLSSYSTGIYLVSFYDSDDLLLKAVKVTKI